MSLGCRPVRMFPPYQFPEKTKGIDVSDTYFGAAPLDMSFDVGKYVKVHVAKDDITRQTTDAIVNPTNARLTHNVSAVSRAIFSAAGVQMQLECEQYLSATGELGVAKVMNTSAGGRKFDVLLGPRKGFKFCIRCIGNYLVITADQSNQVLIVTD